MPPQDADGGQDGTENADTTQGAGGNRRHRGATRRARRARRTTTATIAVKAPTWWRAIWIPHSWEK